MSNPNGRGLTNSQKLQYQADDLAMSAKIEAIREAEDARNALRNAYQVAAGANVSASVSCSRDCKERIIDFVHRCDGIIGAGASLKAAIPLPLLPNEITVYQRQRTYNMDLINNAIKANQEIRDKAFNGAAQVANDIVAAAWLAAVPGTPDRALKPEMESCLTVINTAMGTGMGGNPSQTAQRILTQAIADNDSAMLATLLGEPARRLLIAMGVDRADLVRQYARPMVDALKNNPYPQDSSKQVTGGAFLLLQDGSQALNKLPALADDFYKAMQKRVNDLLNMSIVAG